MLNRTNLFLALVILIGLFSVSTASVQGAICPLKPIEITIHPGQGLRFVDLRNGECMGFLRFWSNDKDIGNVLGPATEIRWEQSEQGVSPYLVYAEDGLGFLMGYNGRYILRMDVWNDRAMTIDGLMVGDDFDRAFDFYDKPLFVLPECYEQSPFWQSDLMILYNNYGIAFFGSLSGPTSRKITAISIFFPFYFNLP